ncbi:MAG: FAD-dependent oxidoreductase [Anaerolineae bacterium]|nr:FAD-dependent oxidoreductase [Anaerolineae bacterium]
MKKIDQPIIVYGTAWCPDCKRVKQFLGDQRIPYTWVDIEQDAGAMAYVEEINDGMRIVPTLICPDGMVLTEPSNAELAEKLELQTKARREFYDIIVVGAGPAGLTAALYTAREGLSTLVVEKAAPGGQAGITQVIENFPGFDEGISGEEFARRLTNQAGRFGAEILQAQEVVEVRTNGQYREIITAGGDSYAALTVLIATGARYRTLGIPGEEDLIGINVHFCATCDGAFYKDKDVLVIGGGNSGFEEGLFLTHFARHVTIVEYEPKVRASQILQDKVASRDDMTVVTNHAVQAFEARQKRLSAVKVMDRATQALKTWRPDGVFIFVGMSPNSSFVMPEIKRNRAGFIVTDHTLQTSVQGVFAAGDVREGAIAQAASAAGEGVAAALMMRQYIQSL